MGQKGNALPLVIIGGVILFVAVVGGLYFWGKQQKSSPAPATPEAPTPVAQPPSTPPATRGAQIPTDPNTKTFSSIDLGISFNYLEMQNGEKFADKAVGSKVYVYQTKFPVEQGQYVEVFPKNAADDLKTAIEKKFLANYSKTDCFVIVGKNPVAKQTVPATFVFAQITIPTSPNDGMEELSAKWQKCPTPYTATNGLAYFLMNLAHPDKFVFFSIGQYSIDGGPGGVLWQSTLKFL